MRRINITAAQPIQIQQSQALLSVHGSLVSIRQAATGTVAASAEYETGPGDLRSITRTALNPRRRIVDRIAASSCVGVIACQPAISITLHAGEALAQP